MFMRSSVLLLGSLLCSGLVHSEQQLIHVGLKPDVFREWHRVADNYFLITGPIQYVEEDTELFTKGFRVTSSADVYGELKREIYDYPKSQSATNIYEQVKRSLKAQGYEELFTCKLDTCGEVDGWRLYLSDLIGDHVEFQYYIAAKKDVEGDRKTNYVAFYVNEIDGQARSLVDMVSKSWTDKFDVLVDAKEVNRILEKDGRVSLGSVLFDLDSSQVKDEYNDLLLRISQFLKSNQANTFAIVGHTDSTGSLAYNKKLAVERAKSVRNALIKKYGVNKSQLSVASAGAIAPVVSNTDDQGRALNRRVEIIQLK